MGHTRLVPVYDKLRCKLISSNPVDRDDDVLLHSLATSRLVVTELLKRRSYDADSSPAKG